MTVRTAAKESVDTVATEFWLGPFDFPMIDNIRLPHDQRLAVVLNNFDAAGGRADLTLADFPGKYAGLREKPYYDEVLAKLLAANQNAAAAGTEVRPTPTAPRADRSAGCAGHGRAHGDPSRAMRPRALRAATAAAPLSRSALKPARAASSSASARPS